MLTDQRSHQTRTRTSFSHLLTGLIFDDSGHRMAPTQAQKKGRHYSYYVSRPLLFGNAAHHTRKLNGQEATIDDQRGS